MHVDVDGQKRTAEVHVPQGWDGKSALPTLYYFKALKPGAPEPESFTGLSQAADKAGVAVVYLHGEGLLNSYNNGQRDFGRSWWSALTGTKDGPDENKYLNAVHDKLSTRLPLDASRQGLTGFSHGGSEAYALASQNNWVSSVQSDEGYMTGYEKPLNRPMSQQTIHALHDPVIPYGGTEQVGRIADKEAENDMEMSKYSGEPFIDLKFLFHYLEYNHEKNGNMIQDQKYIVDAYNRANGLVDPKTGKAGDPAVTQRGDITTRSWVNTANGAETRQVILGTGTHGWAGSIDHRGDIAVIGIPNETFNASEAMLDFLKKHPLIDVSAKPVETQPAP